VNHFSEASERHLPLLRPLADWRSPGWQMQGLGDHPVCTSDEGARKTGERPCMRHGAAPLSNKEQGRNLPV